MKIFTSFTALAILATVSGAKYAPAQGKHATSTKKARGKFTISKETTCVTGPTDKDGYIDYVAALNERLSEGVTPANNANVLLCKVFGPHPEGRTMPAEFFKLMGIESPPKNGKYFISPSQYMKKHVELDPAKKLPDLQKEFRAAGDRPWQPAQYPLVAGWLTANEAPLALAAEASKRPRYFAPLVPKVTERGPGGLVFASFGFGTTARQSRELASLLQVRAMLHLGEGRSDEAWQDILACHRLARLVARGGSLLEALIGVGIDARANDADLVFLDHAKLDSRRIKACLRDLQSLPPMPGLAEKFDGLERFLVLDTVMMLDRYGIDYLESIFQAVPPKAPHPLAKGLLDNIDWDPFLRDANRLHDRLAAALRAKDPASRAKQLNQLEEDLKANRKVFADMEDLIQRLVGAGPNRAKILTEFMIAGSSFPAQVGHMQQEADRIEQMGRNVEVAFALGAYRRDHGRSPMELDALAPKYLSRVPLDLYSGKAPIYRRFENSYLLYSVGPNGRDDAGRSRDDNPPGDDIRARMPLSEP